MMKGKLERIFLPKTMIYDPALATKVREELQRVMKYGILKGGPDQRYQVEVSFSEDVYKTDEFFSFPVLKETPIQRRGRKYIPESEIRQNKIGDILSEQLDNVIEVFETEGIHVWHALIVGEWAFPEDVVFVSLYTYEPEQEPGEKKKSSRVKTSVIMPSRQGFYRNLAKAGEGLQEWRKREQEREEREKNERLQHTPHFVRAEELFTEIAQAVHPSDCAQSTLYKEMLYKTAVQTSDWPLTIKSRRIKTDDNTSIDKDTKFDCPEYMIYTQQTTGEWSIEKIENLTAAQSTIVNHGYNLKKTDRIVVLHNLKSVPYTLFKNTAEGLVMVTPEEARGEKKLYLSWNK